MNWMLSAARVAKFVGFVFEERTMGTAMFRVENWLGSEKNSAKDHEYLIGNGSAPVYVE
ncbi:MAG: hypothetical protein Hyperionvirus21_4 [Hyperionvirus sp.]|uniref:Uncharacterized protein n=1 Tax=Hyperionvirus sp. TaxID=2487770 RepID=A0A3G5AAJ4_9VIRU|nr:MAG: hypothetical protein Hyperionvirus21_4 [Hyperionvirus sp.]